ncbi:hypothetical protein [Amycolatopsis decaplanina]|uniref:Uncharacterized protein n=1 Tax=Amycolatopsis decaplanina DSM 44594 TaxID=1284240 RepID=M2Y4T7_9PSEU|nr:hypothetical protein [Amycolatopsis decaplanina]EME56600.1 hypothetical protein H074_22064 [Amycolatopsis decaplanina DSM 44594]
MYRPSVQAVPGAKALHRPVAPMARHAVRNVQDAPSAPNVRNVVSRLRSRSRPNAVSARGGPHRRLLSSRWTVAASGSRAVPTTRHGG